MAVHVQAAEHAHVRPHVREPVCIHACPLGFRVYLCASACAAVRVEVRVRAAEYVRGRIPGHMSTNGILALYVVLRTHIPCRLWAKFSSTCLCD